MTKLITFCLVVMLYESVSAWRMFFRGRERGGNLGTPSGFRSGDVSEHWYTQQLDHFDPTNIQQWKQRYFVNDQHFDFKNGPVFLMIGGEGPLSPGFTFAGAMERYAEKYKALALGIEHRYYGRSHPVSELTVKNLSFLTSEQALADIAAFIVMYNEKLGRNAKWIVFGGSYSGSLAAWMRLKYPHLVAGAVSSSGPLLAIIDFKDYFEVVEESLAAQSEECVKAIEEGTAEFSSLLNHREGQESLLKLFKLCDPIDSNNKNDVSMLYDSLAGNFAEVVQYNNDFRNSATFGINIEYVCNIMTDTSLGKEVNRLAKINSILLEREGEKCLDYKYKNMIAEMRSQNWSSSAVASGMRQWVYQTCTEFGFFQSSDLNVTQKLFGNRFPVGFYEQQCKDIYGRKFNTKLLEKAVQRTNTIYGGLDVNVDNIVYVQGSIDPWHVLGITKTLRQKAPAIFIQGTAHCADMYPSSPDDLPQLIEARNEIERIIGTWLSS